VPKVHPVEGPDGDDTAAQSTSSPGRW
jgi:hypothetical protein